MRKIAEGKADLFLQKEKTRDPREEDPVPRGIEGEGRDRGAETDSDVSATEVDLPEDRDLRVITVTVPLAVLVKGTDLEAGLDLAHLGGRGIDPEAPPKNVGKWTIRKRNRNHRIKMVNPVKTRATAGNPV